jgi:hypothetical protein
MEHYPDSPEEIIDPRWETVLHADTAQGPAHHPNAGRLGQAMNDIIEPWQRGLRGTRETLEALRDLANREL